MKSEGVQWIGEVLADIQQFCDVNGLSKTAGELAKVQSVLLAERGAEGGQELQHLFELREHRSPTI